MALSALDLVNRALVKIGAAPIVSFDENNAQAEAAGLLYPSVRDTLLSSYPWNFASTIQQLVRLIARPVADYDYAFQLPADFLRALSAGQPGKSRGVTYQLVGRKIHSNAEAITLSYIYRPAEANCPAYFDTALIARLAAELTLPLTASTSRAEALHRIAEQEFKRARLVDAQQDTPTCFEDFSLIAARSQ